MRSTPRRARSAAPGAALALAALWCPSLDRRARAGIGPPGKDPPAEWNGTGEGFFQMRPLSKRYTGKLAKCSTCGRPLKDHLDPNFVCRDPTRSEAPLEEQKARCPVCSHGFKGSVPETGRIADMDRDFCRHPRGAAVLATDVWLCPRCGYAALHGDFNRPVAERIKQIVAKSITPGTKTLLATHTGLRPKGFKIKDFGFLPQDCIPEYLKYENAAAIYQKRGAGHRTMARLHLGASHVYRRLANRPFTEGGLDRAIRSVEAKLGLLLLGLPAAEKNEAAGLARAARRLLARADRKEAYASEKLGRRERFYLLMRLAGIHDRLGEAWFSRKCLIDAAALAAQEKEEDKKRAYRRIVERVGALFGREFHHQKLAAGELRPALASGDIPEAERLMSVYLLGELLLRTGQLGKALPWFEAATRLAEGGRVAPGSTSEAAGRGRVAPGSTVEVTRRGRVAPGSTVEVTRRGRVAPGSTVEVTRRGRVAPGSTVEVTRRGGGEPEARGRLAAWSRERLRSPVFYEVAEKGAKPKRIAADAAERAFVEKIVPPADGAPAEEARAPEAPPAGRGAPPAAAGPEAEAPKTCREQMERTWKAIRAYSEAHGQFPRELRALVGAGLISRRAAGNFACVESGNDLFYRRPPAGSGKTFILYHNSPSRCPCKNMLWSDGTISRFGK